MKFSALVVRETPARASTSNRFSQTPEERDTESLPPGELLIRVSYSSLNYKDSLSATGNRGVTRNYPHTPGIDAAGTVEESSSPEFEPGAQVIVTGFDLGMNTPGGFGQFIRVPAAWVVACPQALGLRSSMVFGTAGFTAAIAAERLTAAGVSPEAGRILVTGAKGGVGGCAVALLSHLGYEVVAATGTVSAEAYLRRLGAAEVLTRQSLELNESRPLLHAQWAGAVDTVGGSTLSTVIKSISYGGAIAACGNVASASFEASVYPFILRGVSLLGVDSASYPKERRERLWEQLAGVRDYVEGKLQVEECTLAGLPEHIARMLRGELTGRVVVDLRT